MPAQSQVNRQAAEQAHQVRRCNKDTILSPPPTCNIELSKKNLKNVNTTSLAKVSEDSHNITTYKDVDIFVV